MAAAPPRRLRADVNSGWPSSLGWLTRHGPLRCGRTHLLPEGARPRPLQGSRGYGRASDFTPARPRAYSVEDLCWRATLLDELRSLQGWVMVKRRALRAPSRPP